MRNSSEPSGPTPWVWCQVPKPAILCYSPGYRPWFLPKSGKLICQNIQFETFEFSRKKPIFCRGLADINGDGQMDVNEFSVACKLITSKLKGIELPKTLPPQMMPAMPGMMPGMMQQPMVRMNAAGKPCLFSELFLSLSIFFFLNLKSFWF